MVARLPTPGGDANSWGEILNDYLSQVHGPTGALKNGTVNTNNLVDGAVTTAKLSSSLQTQITEGTEGPQGPAGPQGAQGATGPQGPAGPGVPAGGSIGQVLAKSSENDYDTAWVDQASGGGGPITIADLPAGSVAFAHYNEATSAWPSRPTARTDVMVHWIGSNELNPPAEALSGVDIWDWATL